MTRSIHTAWQTLIDGYAGTPAIMPFRTELSCAPAIGLRLADPEGKQSPIDDYYVYSADADAPQIIATIRSVPPAPRAYLTVAAQSDATDAVYRALGCVYDSSECLMSFDLTTAVIPPPVTTVDILTVADISAANMADPESMLWLSSANVSSFAMTHVAIRSGAHIHARARTLRLADGTSYVSMVYTAPSARRQGYGKDLMRALLAADQAAGTHTVVLMSSQMGIPLYRSLGFVPLCTTHIYTLS
jgi:GNAT superfamily N-acetyltransferase